MALSLKLRHVGVSVTNVPSPSTNESLKIMFRLRILSLAAEPGEIGAVHLPLCSSLP